MHHILAHPVFLLLFTIAARGGVLTTPVRIVKEVFVHGADNAAVHVATHYGDDAAKAVAHYGDDAAKAATHHGDDAARMAARGGETAATHLTPQVVRTVDAAVDAARVEAHAAQPAVEAIHRTPIVRPMHLAAGGAAVGTVVAAHNLTAGEREKDRAIADATRQTVAEHPELLPDVVRANGEQGFVNQIAAGFRRGCEWALPILAGLLGLGFLIRATGFRKRRKPAVIDVTPEPAAADQPAQDATETKPASSPA